MVDVWGGRMFGLLYENKIKYVDNNMIIDEQQQMICNMFIIIFL
jgi:hypothetical protein